MGVASTDDLWWPLSVKQPLLIQISCRWEASAIQPHSFWVLRRQVTFAATGQRCSAMHPKRHSTLERGAYTQMLLLHLLE